jgi:type I restriction enzyme S subunit
MVGRYLAYPEYNDSGVEWLDAIPADWVVSKVKHLTDFQVGWTPPTKVDANFIGDNLWANISDLRGKYIDCTGKNISDEAAKAASMEITPKGSLLYSFKLSVGAVSFARQNMYTNEAIASFLEGGLLPLSYMYYALPKFVIENASTNIYGARILNQELINNALLLKPSYDEAEKIANFLDHETAKIDTLIEKQQQLIKLLKEKRQAVISHAVTKGLNPNATMRDSGVEWLGEVPEHWVVRRLKHTSKLQSGIPKGKDLTGKSSISVPMLRVANVQDGYLNLEAVHEMEIESNQLERFTLEKGDVLMNEGGDNDKLGRGAVWQGEITPCIHQNHVFAIRPYSIEPGWLDLVTRASYAKFHFFRVAKQSTNLASISSTNIKETPLVIPPENERAEIMEYVTKKIEAFDNAEVKCSAQIILLQERRTALISAAVTGKIDVRSWVA